jgi:hypothetical protein
LCLTGWPMGERREPTQRNGGKEVPRGGARLTGAVNIAVFAAFWPRVGGGILADAGLQRVCGDRQLDVWRYGWQKRQDVAKKWQRMARPAAKTANLTPNPTPRAREGTVRRDRYLVVKVLAGPGGRVLIELIYHELRRWSRRKPHPQPCNPRKGRECRARDGGGWLAKASGRASASLPLTLLRVRLLSFVGLPA